MIPTVEQCLHLKQVLLSRVFPEAGRKHVILLSLFAAFESDPTRTKPLTSTHLLTAWPGDSAAPASAGALRRLLCDLKKDLDEFFGSPEGQLNSVRITYSGRGNYWLAFQPNVAVDYVPLFWRSYRDGNVKLMYPEPFFVIDNRGTYFRNSAVNGLEDVEQNRHLFGKKAKGGSKGATEEKLEMAYSYVPAGIVQGLFFITDALARQPMKPSNHSSDRRIAAEPIPPYMPVPPESSNLIVLATPTSIRQVVEFIEDGLDMRTTIDGVIQEAQAPRVDSEDKQNHLVKWGVVSRRPDRGRVITLISANHGRTVEAIAEAITQNSQLEKLAKALSVTNSFPDCFQALYRVQMGKRPVGTHIRGIELVAATVSTTQ